MTSSPNRRAMNICSVCRAPLHPSGGCISPDCTNYHLAKPMEQRNTSPPGIDISIDVEHDPSLSSQPLTTRRHSRPTRDLPPEEKALREWLAIPQSDRPGWPDNDACSHEACGRPLELMFRWCPYCGRKRELPPGVRGIAAAYEAALKPQSIPSMPIPAIPPPPDEPSLAPPPRMPPPRQAVGPSPLGRRYDPRAEDDGPVFREERVPIGTSLLQPKKPLR